MRIIKNGPWGRQTGMTSNICQEAVLTSFREKVTLVRLVPARHYPLTDTESVTALLKLKKINGVPDENLRVVDIKPYNYSQDNPECAYEAIENALKDNYQHVFLDIDMEEGSQEEEKFLSVLEKMSSGYLLTIHYYPRNKDFDNLMEIPDSIMANYQLLRVERNKIENAAAVLGNTLVRQLES